MERESSIYSTSILQVADTVLRTVHSTGAVSFVFHQRSHDATAKVEKKEEKVVEEEEEEENEKEDEHDINKDIDSDYEP